jgi:hypothetical protein
MVNSGEVLLKAVMFVEPKLLPGSHQNGARCGVSTLLRHGRCAPAECVEATHFSEALRPELRAKSYGPPLRTFANSRWRAAPPPGAEIWRCRTVFLTQATSPQLFAISGRLRQVGGVVWRCRPKVWRCRAKTWRCRAPIVAQKTQVG